MARDEWADNAAMDRWITGNWEGDPYWRQRKAPDDMDYTDEGEQPAMSNDSNEPGNDTAAGPAFQVGDRVRWQRGVYQLEGVVLGIDLSRAELVAVIRDMEQVAAQMAWNEATYLTASGNNASASHITPKSGDAKHQRTLCGKLPKYEWGWSLSPVIGAPSTYKACKVCLGIWQKRTKS